MELTKVIAKTTGGGVGSQAGQFCGPVPFPEGSFDHWRSMQLTDSFEATWMQDVFLRERQCLSQAVMIHVGRAEVGSGT